MKLTEEESRFVKKWQKRERSWRWLRWFCLSASLAFIVAYAVILRWLISYAVDSPSDAAGVAWASPIAWICLMTSSGWLGFTLAHWRGDLKTRLLLRLVEEHENDAA